MDIKTMQPTAIKWGLIKGVASVLVGMLSLQFIGNVGMSLLTSVLSLAIPILVLVFAFKEYKAKKDGFMVLKEAIVLGLGIYLIEFVVGMVWNGLYNYVINPGAQEEAMDKALEQMEQSPGMTDGMLDMFEGFMETSNSFGGQLIFGLLSALFFGALWSLIIGAIMKKDPV